MFLGLFFFLKNVVLRLGFGLTLTLTLKHSVNKKIDPNPDPHFTDTNSVFNCSWIEFQNALVS